MSQLVVTLKIATEFMLDLELNGKAEMFLTINRLIVRNNSAVPFETRSSCSGTETVDETLKTKDTDVCHSN